jgi:hypothetical protein
LFVDSSIDLGIGVALTAAELATFKQNFKSISQADTGLNDMLAAYGGYPFEPLRLPLDRDSLLRAVIALKGRDKALDGRKSLYSAATQTDRVVARGRTAKSKLELLFREDILDVLVVIQPHPNPRHSPLDRNSLVPIATKLAGSKVIEDLSVPKGKLRVFLKDIGIGIENLEVNEDVSFETFKKIVEENASPLCPFQGVHKLIFNFRQVSLTL